MDPTGPVTDLLVLLAQPNLEARLHTAWDQLVTIFTDVVAIAILFLIARAISRFIQRRVWKRVPIDEVTPATESLINNSIAIAVYAIAFTLTLAFLGASWSTLLTAFSISTIAVVFGFSDLLKSIMGGAVLIFERPYQVGDRIRFRDSEGEVTEIGVRTTTMVTDDRSTVIVPNSLHLSEPFRNLDRGQKVSSVIRIIGIDGQETDVGTMIRQILGTDPAIDGYVALSSNAQHSWLDRMLLKASDHGIGSARRQKLEDPSTLRARVVLQTDSTASREAEAEATRRLREAFPNAIVSVRRSSLIENEQQDVD